MLTKRPNNNSDMDNDWKDILAAMGGALPEDDSAPAEVTDSPATILSATIFFERKGRAGKSVTIIGDIVGGDEDSIAALASDLRHKLGTGGSARGGEILIQGDRRDDVRRLLKERCIRVKG